MRYDLVLFDADGTLIDSRARSWRAAARILEAFGQPVNIDSAAMYKEHFGRAAIESRFGERHLPALRAMHRLVMLEEADKISPFEEVVGLASRLSVPRGIVTASWTETVTRALGASATVFEPILGFDFGKKIEILLQFDSRRTLYIGDTEDDGQICAALGIDFIGVGWGFDSIEALRRTPAIRILNAASALAEAFVSLGLMPVPDNRPKEVNTI